MEVLGAHGLEGLTARRIAAAAGVSPGTVFHHFDSLEQMELEAMTAVVDASMEPVRVADHASVRSYLEALGASTEAVLREQPAMVRAFVATMARAVSSDTLRRGLADYLARWLERIAADLRALQPPGAPDPAPAALAAIMLMDSIGLHAMLFAGLNRDDPHDLVLTDLDRVARFWRDAVAILTVYLTTVPPGHPDA